MWFRSKFGLWKDYINLIPTLSISISNYDFTKTRQLTIEFGFLTFHARLMWMWERRNG